MPATLLFARCRGPIVLLGLPSRPNPCCLPALLAAIALPRPPWTKPPPTSFEQTPSRSGGTSLAARQPFPPAALLIFGMACSTLGRAQGRSLLPEAPAPEGKALLSGAQQIFGSIRDQQLYRKDRMPADPLQGVLLFPPAAARRSPAANCFPHQFSPAGIPSPLPIIGGVVPTGPPKWLPPPPPLTTIRGICAPFLSHRPLSRRFPRHGQHQFNTCTEGFIKRDGDEDEEGGSNEMRVSPTMSGAMSGAMCGAM